MKSYEAKDSGGRVVCKEHKRIRCSECAYVNELETEVFRLQDELNGDGVLSLKEQVGHAHAEIRRQDNEIEYLREGLTSIADGASSADSPDQLADTAKYYLEGRTD